MQAIHHDNYIVPIASISRIEKAWWNDKLIVIFLNHAIAGTTHINFGYENKEARDCAFGGLTMAFNTFEG